MKKTLLVMGAAVALFAAQNASAYVDPFNSIDPGWTTDRREPLSFSSVSFGGDNRLQITVSGVNETPPYDSNFYRTQGRQHQALVTGPWTFSFQQYVGADAVSGSSLRRSDGWARTGTLIDETGADYYIMGYRRFDTADPFNVSAANITSAFRVWDSDTVSGWVDLVTPVTTGWHDWSATFTGSAINYLLDGNLVYTDTTVSLLAGSFTTVFAQGYNFGGLNGSYDVYFDNFSATAVPEPTSVALLGLGSFALLGRARRRKK